MSSPTMPSSGSRLISGQQISARSQYAATTGTTSSSPYRLIRRSTLHVYHGGHLELAADPERLASAVQAFLDADLTTEESQP